MKVMLDLNVLLDVVQRREPCDCIVTRNVADFAGSPVQALTPEEFLIRMGGAPED